MNTQAELFMLRALELAEIGRGQVAPNPMVGCVIVSDNQIIGEGWHQKYGQAHAEVNAVNSVKDSAIISKSTVYVTLEPCAHYGKTPPCADLLVSLKPEKVIICNLDPNPLVAGKGVEKLRNAGIEVEIGLLETQGRELNKRFFTFFEEKRPFILLKWAETADGFISRKNYDSKWISNSLSRKLVHKWRSEESAIMVGTNTAHYDNPQLNAREWAGNQPIRVVMDRNLRLGKNLHLFDKQQLTICYNLLKNEENENLIYVKLTEENFTELIFKDLYERRIQSILVEGGSFLLNELISKGLWDEARVFKSRQTFVEGILSPNIRGKLAFSEKVLEDWLFVYQK